MRREGPGISADPSHCQLRHISEDSRDLGVSVRMERNWERTSYFSAGTCWFMVINYQLTFYLPIF